MQLCVEDLCRHVGIETQVCFKSFRYNLNQLIFIRQIALLDVPLSFFRGLSQAEKLICVIFLCHIIFYDHYIVLSVPVRILQNPYRIQSFYGFHCEIQASGIRFLGVCISEFFQSSCFKGFIFLEKQLFVSFDFFFLLPDFLFRLLDGKVHRRNQVFMFPKLSFGKFVFEGGFGRKGKDYYQCSQQNLKTAFGNQKTFMYPGGFMFHDTDVYFSRNFLVRAEQKMKSFNS